MNITKKRVVFYAFTTYQLYTCLYYAVNVRWNPSLKKHLYFYHGLQCQIELERWKPYFDTIHIVRDHPDHFYGRIRHLVLRILSGRYLYPLLGICRAFLHEWKDDTLFICFSDQNDYTLSTIRTLKRHKNNTVCMIEEGEGTYETSNTLSRPSNYSAALKRLIRTLIGVNNLDYIGQSGEVDVWIVRQPDRWPPQKKFHAQIIRQSNVFTNIQSVFDLEFLHENLPASAGKKIIWIGAPVYVHGISEKEEIAWISQIARKIENDYHIYIRKHPREMDTKYSSLYNLRNVSALDIGKWNWIPVEILTKMVAPEAIITVASSAAFHLHDMGEPCKIIYTYRYFHNITIETNFLDEYASFPNVYCIGSIDELERVLYEKSLEEQTVQVPSDPASDLDYLASL